MIHIKLNSFVLSIWMGRYCLYSPLIGQRTLWGKIGQRNVNKKREDIMSLIDKHLKLEYSLIHVEDIFSVSLILSLNICIYISILVDLINSEYLKLLTSEFFFKKKPSAFVIIVPYFQGRMLLLEDKHLKVFLWRKYYVYLRRSILLTTLISLSEVFCHLWDL